PIGSAHRRHDLHLQDRPQVPQVAGVDHQREPRAMRRNSGVQGQRTLVAVLCGALLLPVSARATTAETKVKLLIRDKAASSARIVERLGQGVKLTVLGYSPDGAWVH